MRVTICSGAVGLGKTSIVKKVALEIRSRCEFPKGVFYFDCLDMATSQESVHLAPLILTEIALTCDVSKIEDRNLKKLYQVVRKVEITDDPAQNRKIFHINYLWLLLSLF